MNFFGNDVYGDDFVHRRIKTREIFDLAESAYLDLRRAVHRAEAVADAAAVADSDDDADDDGAPPPPPRQQLASETTLKRVGRVRSWRRPVGRRFRPLKPVAGARAAAKRGGQHGRRACRGASARNAQRRRG